MAGSGGRAVRRGSDWLAPSGWLPRWPYLALIVVFGASRLVYRFALDLQFDYSPVYEFIQYIDPWFVQHDFLRSILYLHQQAPLQNLLTGGCIRIFGTPAAFVVLEAIYVALGLATTLSMLHAMLRLGATRTIATVFAALYAVSPVTVFYEYWLLYHAPVVALLALSVVALLRYYRIGTLGAGLLFYGLFATASLFYAMLHPLLLVAVTLALLVRPPTSDSRCDSPRVRVLIALCVPLCLLGLDRARTRILVGHSRAGAFLWVNLANKTFYEMRSAQRETLARMGLIPIEPEPSFFSIPPSTYGALRVPHPSTGVPLLDMETTPDGRVNPQAIELVLIAEKYYEPEALTLLRVAPDAYARAVLRALTHDYFLSPLDYDETLESANRNKLRRIDRKIERLLLPGGDGRPWLPVIALPAILVCAAFRALGARAVLESERATVVAIACMLIVIAYVTVATTFVSDGDFSRYRTAIDPFYVILLALVTTDLVRVAARAVRRLRAFAAAIG